MREDYTYRRMTRRGRRSLKRRSARKIIPVMVAIMLIGVVVGVFRGKLMEVFMYSSEKADMDGYFSLTAEDEAVVLCGSDYLEEHAVIKNGRYYLPIEYVEQNICDDFYYDINTGELCCTGEDKTDYYTQDDGAVFQRGENIYISLDLIQKIKPFDMFSYTSPNRLELVYENDDVQKADIKKDTNLRVLGGPKSEIIRELSAGEPVVIINPMEEWCEVKTSDALKGYVEIKYLDNYRQETVGVSAKWTERKIKHNIRDHKIVLGWHQVMSKAANDTFDSAVAKTSGMNVISPTWFSIADNSGNIKEIGSVDYVRKAHESGLEVWPLVDNFTEGVDSYRVLSVKESRTELIKQLMAQIIYLGADGINVDFEDLPQSAGRPFAQFIRELSVECRKFDKVLSVDNYVPKGNTSYYDRKTQGEYADYVIIMGYDEHYAGSAEAGSVASFDYVRTGIENTISEVPAEQVINAVPFFTRVWQEGQQIKSQAVGMKEAKDFADKHGLTVSWDENAAQNYGEKTSGDVTYKVWLEDIKSIKVKLELMKPYHLGGVACWKLGLETPDVWEEIAAYGR